MLRVRQTDVLHHAGKGGPQSAFPRIMVLVGGLPGTGKSYFSVRLSNSIQAAYINSDITRQQMDAQGRYAFEDKLDVYDAMLRRAAMELRRGKAVIVDATFYCGQMRDMFFTLARLMQVRPVFIEVIAEEALVRKRLGEGTQARTAALSVHYQVKVQYEPLEMSHLVIESKDDNIDEMLEDAMKYVLKVIDESA